MPNGKPNILVIWGDDLPTAHGFDEFFGILYHLNAEEEPENPDYPSEEEFPRLYALAHPRGVLHTWATDSDTGETDPHYGPHGKQRIEEHRPADQEADGDDRRRDDRRVHRLHPPPARVEHAVLRLDEHDAHARVHTPSRRASARPGGGNPHITTR
jgi:arylsulfatase A-like enzyme